MAKRSYGAETAAALLTLNTLRQSSWGVSGANGGHCHPLHSRPTPLPSPPSATIMATKEFLGARSKPSACAAMFLSESPPRVIAGTSALLLKPLGKLAHSLPRSPEKAAARWPCTPTQLFACHQKTLPAYRRATSCAVIC